MRRFSPFLMAAVLSMLFAYTCWAQTYSTDNYTKQGGSETVIGGTLTVNGSLVYPGSVLTSATTLTTSNCGSIKFLSSATEFDTVLPTPTANCGVSFIVGAAPSGADYTITTGASAGAAETIYGIYHPTRDAGGVNYATTFGTSDRVSIKDGISARGDRLDFMSDGTGWNMIAYVSTSGALTYSSSR